MSHRQRKTDEYSPGFGTAGASYLLQPSPGETTRGFLANTDWDWFRFLRNRPYLDEVNFWQPGGGRAFRALTPGEPLLFRLKGGRNAIGGGGFFATFSRFPISLAWESFGEKNGVSSLEEFRRLIAHYRGVPVNSPEDFEIGCVVLVQPFFLDDGDWIPAPADFVRGIQTGKTYDLTKPPGREIWELLRSAAISPRRPVVGEGRDELLEPPEMFGDPSFVRRRLGQGAFRLIVTDCYERRCAISGEKTLPVLQAAHVKPVTRGGGLHEVGNGLLLRSDIHTLLDRGYVTVTPDFVFRVSKRLRDDWENGRVYYEFDGNTIRLPRLKEDRMTRELLEWHRDEVFLQ